MPPNITRRREAHRRGWDALVLGAACKIAFIAGLCLAVGGCAWQKHPSAAPPSRDLLIAVTPVLNLSGDMHLDTLRITDLVASEMMSYPNVQVVPVNLVVATLARHGRARVEQPEEAVNLARELGADAAVVIAVTEWDPYDPPVMGLVMQWYAPAPVAHEFLDPTAATRQASDVSLSEASSMEGGRSEARYVEAIGRPGGTAGPETVIRPMRQVQRVFNASHRQVQDEVCEYGAKRDGAVSPYDWRRYVKSQELYVRYCCWAMIRTMFQEVRYNGSQRTASEDGR